MAEDQLFANQRVIQARESVYNTDEVDINTNFGVGFPRRFEAYTQADIVPNTEVREREILRPGFSSNRAIVVRRNLGLNFGGHVVAANDPGMAGGEFPFGMADFMVASGMSETLVSTVSATYAPVTTAPAGLTLYQWQRHVDTFVWNFILATGVRGSFQMAAEEGQIATWAFEGASANFPLDPLVTNDPHGWSTDLAYYNAADNIALDQFGDAVTYAGALTTDDPTPMWLEAAVVTIDGTQFPVRSWTINHNNTMSLKAVTQANPTISTVHIVNRGITWELVLWDTGAAWEKAIDKAIDSAELSATAIMSDRLGTGGSTLTITAPKLQLLFPTRAEAEGLAAWTVPCKANGDWNAAPAGDNEISYAWTVT